MNNNHYTLQEIRGQPDAWAEAVQVVGNQVEVLKRLWHDGDFDQVIFTGCGSTYYLSQASASLFQKLTGSPARAFPGGELVLYPKTAYPPGQEQSVAQTRSFASMFVATAAISGTLGGREDLVGAMGALPGVGERLIADYDNLARTLGGNLELDRFYYLGSGPRYGIACEGNLKMKEMTLTRAEPFHFFEFRHGPMSLVTESTVMIGLLSETNFSLESAVLDEMKQLGANILTMGETNTEVAFASGLPEDIRDVLYLPVLQLMAYYRSVAKGLDPDRPKNLSAVVKLDL